MSCSGLICFNNNTGWVWTPSKPINWQYKHDTGYAHKLWLHIKAHEYHIRVNDTEIPVRSHSRLRMYIGTPDTHGISLSHLQIYNAFNHVDNRQIGAITHTYGVSGEGGSDDCVSWWYWRLCELTHLPPVRFIPAEQALVERSDEIEQTREERRRGEQMRDSKESREERSYESRNENAERGYSGENNTEESREEMTGEGTEQRTKKRYERGER